MNQFILTSPTFKNKEKIPTVYTCEGKDISPPLEWTGAPPGTESFALTFVDPDAPFGDWVHWIIWDIPVNLTYLKENYIESDTTLINQGLNSWGRSGYGGPCPPRQHGVHRYFFTIYAVDKNSLELSGNIRLADLLQVLDGHILSEAVLIGKYERK